MMERTGDQDRPRGERRAPADQAARRSPGCSTARRSRSRPTEDPRKPLADWMTAPDNPYLRPRDGQLGLGPVLRQGAGRPARRPEPVEPAGPSRAARRPGPAFRRAQVRPPRPDPDDRHVARRTGCRRRPCRATSSDNRLFSHQIPRPLTAHQMADALAQATDVVNRYPNRAGRHPGDRGRATRRPRARSSTPSAAARAPTAAPRSRRPPLSLRQSLLRDRRRRDREQGGATSNGYLANLLELNPEPDEIVENLYLRTLCRPPTSRGAVALVGRAEAGRSRSARRPRTCSGPCSTRANSRSIIKMPRSQIRGSLSHVRTHPSRPIRVAARAAGRCSARRCLGAFGPGARRPLPAPALSSRRPARGGPAEPTARSRAAS